MSDNGIILNIKNRLYGAFNSIKLSFKECLSGEENLNVMLWCWCLIPNIILYFINSRLMYFLNFGFFKILYLFYNLMCLYFILKAVSVHPEYNVSKIQKQEEMEYRKSLSKDELKTYKSEVNKEKAKDLVKKALLLKGWKTVEFYKTVRLIIVLIILVTLKGLVF